MLISWQVLTRVHTHEAISIYLEPVQYLSTISCTFHTMLFISFVKSIHDFFNFSTLKSWIDFLILFSGSFIEVCISMQRGVLPRLQGSRGHQSVLSHARGVQLFAPNCHHSASPCRQTSASGPGRWAYRRWKSGRSTHCRSPTLGWSWMSWAKCWRLPRLRTDPVAFRGMALTQRNSTP